MIFRKATKDDVLAIMKIIAQAQEYMKKNGIDQWQNQYPNSDTILEDIKHGYSYVCLEDGKIIGTIAVIFDGDKTYDVIYNGEWLSNEEYATIHRIAIDNNYKGLGVAQKMISCVEEMCHKRGISSIKVDTHEDNISMQNMLKKHGFKYCGVIYLEDQAKRIAFEKVF